MNIIHPQTGEKAVSIDDAKAALWEAQKHYEKVKFEADAARRLETDALNELNKAQRVFDAAVSDVRAQAPRDSGWKLPQTDVGTVEVP